ncbi:MAG: phosphotransferase [Clostridiales bacterium]|nr:phosphotransferase [Clostridiales bacterium]
MALNAENKSVVIGVDKNDILSLLEKDKKIFDAVTQPVLVHWDMWEGNIFIKDGCITGIIDWERALWGEPLMDDSQYQWVKPLFEKAWVSLCG